MTVAPLAGGLRPEVEVEVGPDRVLLRHGFWETSVPANWALGTRRFVDFLERRISIDEVPKAPGLAGIRELLRAQGCLSPGAAPPSITHHQLVEAFVALGTAAYGRYYRHGVWQRVAAGKRAPLVAWLAHNLQLSRSVGQTAARAALLSADASARAAFLENCLEEYDHFERYFQVSHRSLGIPSADFSRAVPGPATLAFTLQMLHMAESDWRAHVLVAWFQERTATFAHEASQFYASVERSSNLPGFFRPWLAHVDYDQGCAHADKFRSILERDAPLDRSQLNITLRNASFAVQHLLRALDEIAAPPPPKYVADDQRPSSAWLRLPPEQGRIDPRATRLLDAWPQLDHALHFEPTTLADLLRQFREAGMLRPLASQPPGDAGWVCAAIGRAALRALGNSEQDSDLAMLGKLVQHFPVAESDELPSMPACRAVASLLDEAARSPWRFALLLRLLLDLVPLWGQSRRCPSADLGRVRAWLDDRLKRAPALELDETLTSMIAFTELVLAWQREERAPPRDVFEW